MLDCPNAEIRDRLPEFVAGSLDPSELADVRSHLETCSACREEVALIQGVRALVIRATPVIDVAAIAARIPAARRQPMKSWSNWRVAAAITIITVGGATVGLLGQDSELPTVPDTIVASVAPVADPVQTPPVAAIGTSVPSTAPTASPAEQIELSTTAEIGQLTDSQLDALLKEIDKIEALPLAEPPRTGLPAGAIVPGEVR
jgi:anti-sigma factor RsiW